MSSVASGSTTSALSRRRRSISSISSFVMWPVLNDLGSLRVGTHVTNCASESVTVNRYNEEGGKTNKIAKPKSTISTAQRNVST